MQLTSRGSSNLPDNLQVQIDRLRTQVDLLHKICGQHSINECTLVGYINYLLTEHARESGAPRKVIYEMSCAKEQVDVPKRALEYVSVFTWIS